MTEENYQDMVISHDKNIDILSASIASLATHVGTTNKKLDDVIDVITHQNVLVERMNNLDANVSESFTRAWDRLGKLETSSDTTGCAPAKALVKEKEVVAEKLKVVNNRLHNVEVDVKEVSSNSFTSTTIRWALGLLIFYSVTFGVYVVKSQHSTDKTLSSYIAKDTAVNEATSKKLDDVVSILRDREGRMITYTADVDKF